MYKTIVSRHVKAYGNQFTYFVSLAGEKTRGGLYSGHITAAYEAEILKYYIRHKYGVTWYTMKAHVSDMDLQAYAEERGFKLTLEGVFQWLPLCIKDKLTHEGSQIAAAFAELELPLKHKELVREAVRKERDHLKRERLILKDKLSKERAVVWRAAQNDAARAWHDAKADLEDLREAKAELDRLKDGIKQTNGCMILDGNDMYDWGWIPIAEMNAKCQAKYGSVPSQRTPLGGVEVTREQALEGLGDPATWDAESKALYEKFRRKPEPCPICQKFPCDRENHLHD